MSRLFTALALALATACPVGLACNDEIHWVDPDVTLVGQSEVALGPTELVVGYRSPAFSPLAELSELPVVDGLQGGTWTMPTLRIASLAPSLTTECSLTSGSETLGSTRLQVPTRPAVSGPASGPGWVEIPDLPIAVNRASGLALSELDGVAATLTCAVTAAGLTASFTQTLPLDTP